MSNIKDLIEIILVALACPLVLPAIIDEAGRERDMMDEEIRQAVSEVREMKQMCGNINMKLINIVTQRGQDWKKKLEAEYQRGLEEGKKATFGLVADASNAEYQKGFEDGKAVNDKRCEGCLYNDGTKEHSPCDICCNAYLNRWTAKPQEDDKIEVGDEVIYNGTTKCIVVRPEDDERYASLIDSDGTHYSADHRECKKTGRHFDIQKILEAMKA